ncbi:MAG: peptidylprolyl isomerase [Bacteroides sp.]|nr:peptidylprolyl isomerase [Bacteroides sp.]
MILLAGLVACDRSAQENVVIRTELGDITLKIETEKAPVTASNFLSLVDQGVYTGAVFYRVVRPDNQPDSPVKIEVIQGGLFDDDMIDSYTPIEHESTKHTGILHTDGVISMARMEPGTASTEIFICVGDQPSLDYGGGRNPDGAGFAAFGKVSEGMDVVRRIQALPDSGQYLIKQVIIDSIFVL